MFLHCFRARKKKCTANWLSNTGTTSSNLKMEDKKKKSSNLDYLAATETSHFKSKIAQSCNC